MEKIVAKNEQDCAVIRSDYQTYINDVLDFCSN